MSACSAEAWHEVCAAINGAGDVAKVKRKHLDAVLECHSGLGHVVASTLRGQKVPRLELFAFVQQHGRVCSPPPVKVQRAPNMGVAPVAKARAAVPEKKAHVEWVLKVRACAKALAAAAGAADWRTFKEAALAKLAQKEGK